MGAEHRLRRDLRSSPTACGSALVLTRPGRVSVRSYAGVVHPGANVSSRQLAKEVLSRRQQMALNHTKLELDSPLAEPTVTAAEPPKREPLRAAKQMKKVLCEG
jgi:hypothetical protein